MSQQIAKGKVEGRRILSTRALVSASILTAISVILTRFFGIPIPIGGLPALRITFGAIPIGLVGIVFGPIAGALSGTVADLVGFMINPMGGMYFPGFTLSAALSGFIPGIVYKILKSNKYNFRDANFNVVNTIMILAMAGGVVKGLEMKNLLTINGSMIMYNGKALGIGYIIGFIFLIVMFIVMPIVVKSRVKSYDPLYSIDKILFLTTLKYIVISLFLNTFWLTILLKKGVMVFLPTRIVFSFIKIPINAVLLYSTTKLIKYIKQ